MTSFDRAADFYDRTRAFPDAAMARFLDVLAMALDGCEEVLEVGVGTGRIAIPLAERGVAVRGIDVSPRMLEVLRARSDAVPVEVADATALPLSDDSVDAVLAVHVMHLIPAWPDAVAEAVRVLRPGGRVVLSGLDVADPLAVWRDRLYAEAGTVPQVLGGRLAEVEAALADRGAIISHVPGATFDRQETLDELIRDFADGVYSRYWQIEEADRRRAAAVVRAQAEAEGVDLGACHPNRHEAIVSTSLLPGG